jgi:hypothetical protein
MKIIPIVNSQLVDILNNFKNELLANGLQEHKFVIQEIDEGKKVNACSKDYLENIKTKMIGRTEDAITLNILESDFKESISKLNADLAEWDNHQGYLVVTPGRATLRYEKFSRNALSTVYPKDGYMAWHNNHDAPGYNVLFSWTENGKGFFRYQDPTSKEIVTINDKPGWTCKVGYFAGLNEMDKLFWHCCSADELRVTVAWIFPSLKACEDFCSQVQESQ